MSEDEKILYGLHRECFRLYAMYQAGEIDRGTYLARITPIDRRIGELEMLMFQDTPAWKALSSTSPPKRGN